ncbi:MAG: hypothetical protein AB1509_08300 [Chloroflexota bacterium]
MKYRKIFPSIFIPLLTILLVLGCEETTSRTPDGTSTIISSPTPLSQPFPNKISTPTPTVLTSITPVVTAPYIEFGSWSPDSQWIAYWVSSQEDVEKSSNAMPGGTLNFMNVKTGDVCAVPQFVTPDNQSAKIFWSDEIEVIIAISEEAFAGRPCQTAVYRKLEKFIQEEMPIDLAFSPDGQYRVHTLHKSNQHGILTFETTITLSDSATPLLHTTWRIDERLGEFGLGGEWISREQFLLYETLDQGPLILDTEHGVIPLLTELMSFNEIPSILGPEEYGMRAIPFPGVERDTFHILVQGVGTESNFPTLRLYHAENGQVEILPFRHAWRKPFSPDGQWLLMDERPDIGGYQSYTIWIRRTEEMSDEWQMIASDVDWALWTEHWDEMAFTSNGQITWQTFPDANIIGEWDTKPFSANPVAWSPNHRILVATGNIPGFGEYGMFLLER